MADEKPEMYVEAFLEVEGGARWRFFDRDALDCVVIEYQEYDTKASTWRTVPNADVVFSFDQVEAVCKAITAIKDCGC